MHPQKLSFFIAFVSCLVLAEFHDAIAMARQNEQGYSVEQQTDVVHVRRDGKLVATYHTLSGTKPIVWPLTGAGGVEMTRNWPMSDADPLEKKDHPHHRSFWFTHGEVNDVDFWAEGDGRGKVVHQGFGRVKATQVAAVIEATNHWMAPDGKRVLVEHRRLTFHGNENQPLLDCDFILTAADGDVHFGDTKEGTFGLRVAESMKLETTPPGSILNAEGLKDGETWGKVSNWVDYTGPIAGNTYGVAIMVHPSTFRSPGRWHVRGYGLFAHNPFGLRHFVGDDQAVGGGHSLSNGSSLNFSYRLVFHRGNVDASTMNSLYDQFASSKISTWVGDATR